MKGLGCMWGKGALGLRGCAGIVHRPCFSQRLGWHVHNIEACLTLLFCCYQISQASGGTGKRDTSR